VVVNTLALLVPAHYHRRRRARHGLDRRRPPNRTHELAT
jgi:hypothetical protein